MRSLLEPEEQEREAGILEPGWDAPCAEPEDAAVGASPPLAVLSDKEVTCG